MKIIECQGCPVRALTSFRSPGPELLTSIDNAKRTNHYKKGQVVFYEGDPAFGLHCINSGKVKLYKSTSEGKRLILRIANPGDQLGHLALFTDQPYSATGEALEDSVICFVDRQVLPNLMSRDSDVTWAIIHGLAAELALTRDRATVIAHSSVRERMAGLLLQLRTSYGQDDADGGVRLDIALSREDLAEMVGTTKESAVRVLSDFRQEKLIKESRRNIVLLSPHRLAEVAGFID